MSLGRYVQIVAAIAAALATTHDDGADEVLVWRFILREASVAIYAIGAILYREPLDGRVEGCDERYKPLDIGIVLGKNSLIARLVGLEPLAVVIVVQVAEKR